MDLHPVDLLIHIINIVVLFILLRFILWKPINRALTSRAARICEELDSAAATRIEAQELKLEYARNIETVEAHGRDILRDNQLRADEEAQEILKNARAQAESLLSDAHEKIASEREQAVINARYEIAQLATDMAARILKREVSSDDNKNAIEDFFRETR